MVEKITFSFIGSLSNQQHIVACKYATLLTKLPPLIGVMTSCVVSDVIKACGLMSVHAAEGALKFPWALDVN